MTSIEWVDVPPGSVEMGSNNRSVLFGNIGPRHEVRIRNPYKISRLPVESTIATKIVEAGDAQIASESEWERAFSIGAIFGEVGTVEALADSATSYWGKKCDGSPFIQPSSSNGSRVRIWRKGQPIASTRSIDVIELLPRRLVKRSVEFDEGAIPLPVRRDSRKIVIEEIVICTLFGIVPSFAWASFNASPGYIAEGWLNLVLGGVFLGLSTGIFWRPRTPTFKEVDGNWKIG